MRFTIAIVNKSICRARRNGWRCIKEQIRFAFVFSRSSQDPWVLIWWHEARWAQHTWRGAIARHGCWRQKCFEKLEIILDLLHCLLPGYDMILLSNEGSKSILLAFHNLQKDTIGRNEMSWKAVIERFFHVTTNVFCVSFMLEHELAWSRRGRNLESDIKEL